uniref:Bifunctional lysine-specific demethylase and histidyl-hydroxylase n=1 Tax=Plectus sambesii TaxID=2011161 RepID=A0A914X7S5_9BILA
MKRKASKAASKGPKGKLNDSFDINLKAKQNGASNGTIEEEDGEILLSAFEIRERQRKQAEKERPVEEQQDGSSEKRTDSLSPAHKKDKKNKQVSPIAHSTVVENGIIELDKQSPSSKKANKKNKKNDQANREKQQEVNRENDLSHAAENINPALETTPPLREKSKRQRKKRKLSMPSGDDSNSAHVDQEAPHAVPTKKANIPIVIDEEIILDTRPLKVVPSAKNSLSGKDADRSTKESPLAKKSPTVTPAKDTREGKKSQSSSKRDSLLKGHLPIGPNGDCFVILSKVDGDPLDFSAFPLSKSDDSTVNGRAALDWILQPFGVDRFFKQVWEKHALVLSRGNAKYHNSLFSTADLSELIRTADLQYGTNINIAKYRDGVRTTLNGQGRVYLKDVKRLIADGCSVQLINPQAFSDRIWYLCELLQEVFGSFVGANTYLTPAGSAGFAPHWDEIDAFLLQLEGRKYWRLYAPENQDDSFPRESSGNFTPEQMANRRPIFEGWLEEGDLMHIPRGYIHVANTDPHHHSLHVTVSVCRRVSYADLLDKLVPDLLDVVADQRVELRRSLPVNALNFAGVADADLRTEKYGTERKAFETSLRSMMNFVTDHVTQLTDAGYDMMAREFFKTALPPKLTHEEQNLSAVGGHGDTLLKGKSPRVERGSHIRFIRRHGQRLMMESEDRSFIVHRMQNSRVYEGKEEQIIDLPVDLADGFAHLNEQYPAWSKVSDLPCATNEAKIQLATILFSVGLILMR